MTQKDDLGQMPKKCRQCKQLESCAWVYKYLSGKGSVKEFAVRWGLMNECTQFEWEDRLTKYDFV